MYQFQIQCVYEIREIMLISTFSTKIDGDGASPTNTEELSVAQQLALKGLDNHDPTKDDVSTPKPSSIDSEEEIEDTDVTHSDSMINSGSSDHNINVMKANPSDDGSDSPNNSYTVNDTINSDSKSGETVDMTMMEDDILPPERSKDLGMVRSSDDGYSFIVNNFNFESKRGSKIVTAKEDLAVMKSEGFAESVKSLSDRPYHAFSVGEEQGKDWVKTMNSIPSLKPVDDSMLQELDAVCHSKVATMPMYEMSPLTDKVCAKVLYGVATGASDLVAYVPHENKAMTLVHDFNPFGGSKDSSNFTKIEMTPSNECITVERNKTSNFDHELSSYRSSLIGHTFRERADSSSFYDSSWMSTYLSRYSIELETKTELSEGSLTEREVATSKDKNGNMQYIDMWKASLTGNTDPRFHINNRNIVDMILSLFHLQMVEGKSEDQDKSTSQIVNYIVTTLREFVKSQLYYKQNIKIISMNIKVKVSDKSGLNGYPEHGKAFTDDVINGKFFMMTPLHCEMYRKHELDESWRDIIALSAAANIAVNSDLYGVNPTTTVADKLALRNLLRNDRERNSDNYISSLTVEGFMPGKIEMTKEQVIDEIISRIITGDEVPEFIKFITKGRGLGHLDMRSKDINIPGLHPHVCKYQVDCNKWAEEVLDLLLLKKEYRIKVFSRLTRLRDNYPKSFNMFIDSEDF